HLAHLQVVIGAKLRRSESFFFTWKKDAVGDGQRGSIWLEKSIPLYFEFDGTPVTSINRQWLEKLTISANSAQGMTLLEEPIEESAPPVTPPAAQARTTRAEPRRGTPTGATPVGSAAGQSRR
ncbi:MAG: ATP-dependent ligase, partial [Glaciihabitans sp.]|nr:ATP-dependent ligase [Glaciihabitans sp.]